MVVFWALKTFKINFLPFFPSLASKHEGYEILEWNYFSAIMKMSAFLWCSTSKPSLKIVSLKRHLL